MHSINYHIPPTSCTVTLGGRDLYDVLKDIVEVCHEKLQEGPKVFEEISEQEIAEYYEGGFCRILDILGD